MYPNPKRAKKLYSEVVPKTVDEYLSLIEKYPTQDKKEQLQTQYGTFIMEIHLMKNSHAFLNALNLVGSSNADAKIFYGNLLIDFIKK